MLPTTIFDCVPYTNFLIAKNYITLVCLLYLFKKYIAIIMPVIQPCQFFSVLKQ